MKKIGLTGGGVALVDDSDFDWLNQWKWYVHSNGCGNLYVRRSSYKDGKFKNILMHRLILKIPNGLQGDHVNGDGLDNRRENLRICTKTQNLRNQFKICGTSKFKGVYWDAYAQKWAAKIRLNRKSVLLGRFDNEIEAAQTYDKAAVKHFGEFAKTNADLDIFKTKLVELDTTPYRKVEK